MHRLKQEQQVSPPPPPAHSTSFRWPIPPPLPPPEAHPTTFEWDPTFPSPPPAHFTPHRWPIPPPPKPSPSAATAEEAAGIIRFLKGSYANHVLPVLTEAKEAVAVMRTTARPTIARDRLSSQSQMVTIRLVRLKDYLASAYLQDLPRMLTGSSDHDHPGHPGHLPPPPKTVKIHKLSEQDLQWRLSGVLTAAHTLCEIAQEVAWNSFSGKETAAAPEVLQQKQQDITSACLQVRDSLDDVLKLFQSALFWVEKATGSREVAAAKAEEK